MSLASRLRAGETVVTAWSSLAAPILSELMAHSGYEAIALDMQHGLHDIASVRDAIASIIAGGAHPAVRVAVDDFATASRVLDFGAEAVIMPMVNSAEDALALVAATKFPPLGARSWAPHQAARRLGYDGLADYTGRANEETLAFAMVETPTALAALDDICEVEGLDGIYVGPSDLSFTLSEGDSVDPTGKRAMEVSAEIAARVTSKGKIAAIYCMTPEHAKAAIGMGYRYVTLGSDQAFIASGVSELLSRLKD
ncbi:hydroxyacid aldolase [Stappia sp. GBMRC 2046]|uniref:Hydroxyacid aldolase n=1 Tax=Stappia sediminis TaxID=2692190 RepID=A0A7X3LRI4_9HYPH|nr:hydroxyacid aldolase [Stappia sediminis]